MKKDLRNGHRKRLTSRLLKYPESLSDMEILELLLFFVISRKDTKQIAFNLLQKFKNLNSIFNTNYKSIEEIEGVGEKTYVFLQILKLFLLRITKEKIRREDCLNSPEEIFKYFRILMNGKTHEELHLVFLDNKNKIIDISLSNVGTINYVNVYIREIIKKSLEVGAVSLIMVHNHPSGNPDPSNADRDITFDLKKICLNVGINLIDHIIIGNNSYFSFLNSGLI